MAELQRRLDRVEQGATEIGAPAEVGPYDATVRGMREREIEACLATLEPDKARDLVTYGPPKVVATKEELIAEGRALLRGLGL